MSARPIRVLLYGDLNLNIIDGSAIWLQSLAETLAVGDRIDLTILLKAPEERGLITDALHAIPGANIVSGPVLAGIDGAEQELEGAPGGQAGDAEVGIVVPAGWRAEPAVARVAVTEGLATHDLPHDLEAYLDRCMYQPVYRSYLV